MRNVVTVMLGRRRMSAQIAMPRLILSLSIELLNAVKHATNRIQGDSDEEETRSQCLRGRRL